MARVDNLVNYLTDIADAIKEKKGDYSPIWGSTFDDEIRNLPTGGDPEPKPTGHVDAEGLRQIGWTEEDINDFQNYGVFWNEEEDDIFKLTDEEKIGTDKLVCRFVPKGLSFRDSFSYTYAIAIPGIENAEPGGTNTYSQNKVIAFIGKTSLEKFTSKPFSSSGSKYGLMYSGLYDFKNISDSRTFYSANYSLEKVDDLDFSNVNYLDEFFNNCYSLKSIGNIITSNKLYQTSKMFDNCYVIKNIPYFITSNVNTASEMFYQCRDLTDLSSFDFPRVSNASNMFSGCYKLKAYPTFGDKLQDCSNMFNANTSLVTAPNLITDNVYSISSMFTNCVHLETIPTYNCGSVTNIRTAFGACNNLKNVGGLIDIGKAYLTSASANYANYSVDFSQCYHLSHDSIINILNGLYDIASAGVQPQSVKLSSILINTLTDEEKAIATNKGWNITT